MSTTLEPPVVYKPVLGSCTAETCLNPRDNHLVQFAGVLDASVLHPSLVEALKNACRSCINRHEEEGGFILYRPESETTATHFEYISVSNLYTGQPIAFGLYSADPEEYGKKIISRYAEGFKNFASFHTHPAYCPALPSGIDLSRLFKGQPNNFIMSVTLRQLFWYLFNPLSAVSSEASTPTWFQYQLNFKQFFSPPNSISIPDYLQTK